MDERLRDLERRWRVTGAQADLLDYLRVAESVSEKFRPTGHQYAFSPLASYGSGITFLQGASAEHPCIGSFKRPLDFTESLLAVPDLLSLVTRGENPPRRFERAVFTGTMIATYKDCVKIIRQHAYAVACKSASIERTDFDQFLEEEHMWGDLIQEEKNSGLKLSDKGANLLSLMPLEWMLRNCRSQAIRRPVRRAYPALHPLWFRTMAIYGDELGARVGFFATHSYQICFNPSGNRKGSFIYIPCESGQQKTQQ